MLCAAGCHDDQFGWISLLISLCMDQVIASLYISLQLNVSCLRPDYEPSDDDEDDDDDDDDDVTDQDLGHEEEELKEEEDSSDSASSSSSSHSGKSTSRAARSVLFLLPT